MTTARIIDYETTGTPDDDHPEVIELAYTDVDIDNRRLGYDWRSFARPRGPIPPVTKAVHHITEADVSKAPEARELFDRMIEGTPEAPTYFVAHNAQFEQHFTPNFGIPWICTYKVSRVVWPDAPGHSNQVLRYWLDLPVVPVPPIHLTALCLIPMSRRTCLCVCCPKKRPTRWFTFPNIQR